MQLLVWGLLALPALTIAQTTVVSILDLGGYQPFLASVVAADAGATTYKLICPSTNGCGYGPNPPEITAVAGPSTAVETVIVDTSTRFSTLACAVTTSVDTQSVSCTRIGKSGTSSFTFFDQYASLTSAPLTVTAGAEKLSGGGGPKTTAGEPPGTTRAAGTSTTVTLFHTAWGLDLAASVVAADATATTYTLGCPGSAPSYCGYPSTGLPTLTAVGGPSTAAQTLSFADLDLEVVVTCKLSAPAAGVCVVSEHSGALTATQTRQAAPSDFGPVMVTAGVEKLDQAKTSSGQAPGETRTNGGSRSTSQRSLVVVGFIVGGTLSLLATL